MTKPEKVVLVVLAVGVPVAIVMFTWSVGVLTEALTSEENVEDLGREIRSVVDSFRDGYKETDDDV